MRKNEKVAIVKDQLIRGHIAETIPGESEDMIDLLANYCLRIKWGIDPTSEHIHLGRAIPILLLRDLQMLGHEIIVIIGDFTAEIGDTSDKESERPVIGSEVVSENMRTYIKQIGLILDLRKTKFLHNSKWWRKMSFSDFVRLTDLFSLAGFSARSNIAKRLESGSRVSVREMIYPIMQGFDSNAMKADVEVGGTDQRFNMLAGRKIQQALGNKPQALIMTNLIDGLDGRKMSSSWGNTINLTDPPDEMYGKLMSMRDEMIITYYIHLTRKHINYIDNLRVEMQKGIINPRDVKMELAKEIVRLAYGDQIAAAAESSFQRVFQEKKEPAEMPIIKVRSNQIINVLLEIGFVKSKSEARRVIHSGGVAIDGAIIKDIFQDVPTQFVLRKGKRHFAKISVE